MGKFDDAIDGLQEMMIYIMLFVIAFSILALMLFDVIAGAGIMMFLTNNNALASVVISLATTGLLVSLMVVAYNTNDDGKKGQEFKIGFVEVAVFVVYILDVAFDSMTADWLRFGTIVDASTIPNPEVQFMFRGLIGGISTVGDAMAFAIIVGMPIVKDILKKALPNKDKSIPKPQQQTKQPLHGVNTRPSFANPSKPSGYQGRPVEFGQRLPDEVDEDLRNHGFDPSYNNYFDKDGNNNYNRTRRPPQQSPKGQRPNNGRV